SSTAAVVAGERRVAAEERRSERLEQDLTVTSAARDNANKEIRRLQKEVVTLGEALTALREELSKCQNSKDNFKRKAQEYCRTLEELTHIMATKDSDQSHLRKQYLTLNETVSSLKSLNASLEETVNTHQQEVDKMETLMTKFKEEREQLTTQIMEAGGRSDNLEETCSKLEEEKYEVERQLVTSQDTLTKLEARRQQLEAEMARITTTLHTVTEERRGLEQRVEAMSGQLSSERTHLRAAEEALTQKRRAEWTAEANIKQLEVEKGQLQRKLTEIQEKFDEECVEGRRARTRASQAETDLERTRRELTEERFERERSTQELRRSLHVLLIPLLQGLLTPPCSAQHPPIPLSSTTTVQLPGRKRNSTTTITTTRHHHHHHH
ncbi:hypothetical protein Pmani_037534, partial [Petrolisthes manimaculis]